MDAAVSNEVLQAVSGNALQAALEAAEQMQQKRQDLHKAIELELEQARYEARLALGDANLSTQNSGWWPQN